MNRGSRRSRTRLNSRMRCFNEAPIHESGKSQVRPLHRQDPLASMRPRFMNRGSAADYRIYEAIFVLQ